MGGVARSDQQKYELYRIVPHARTLRKAREQVMWMVKDGLVRHEVALVSCLEQETICTTG